MRYPGCHSIYRTEVILSGRSLEKYTGDGLITDEAIERLNQQLGVVRDAKPWASEISFDISRHYAEYCLGSDNPLWLDADYGKQAVFGECLPAPGTEYVACSADKRLGGPGLPGIHALHAGDEWEFYHPLRLRDVLRATVSLASMDMRTSKWGGKAIWQKVEIAFYNQSGTLVSHYRPTTIRAERNRAKATERYVPDESYQYSDEEIEDIFLAYEAEKVRGQLPLFIDELAVGDSIGHVVKGPYTVMDLMCWWIGTGGPYIQAFKQRHLIQKKYPKLAIRDKLTNIPRSPEDAHFDSEYAARSGVGNMYDIGRQRTACFIHLLTNWFGDQGRLRKISVRFTAPNFLGNVSKFKGTIKSIDASSGVAVVDLFADDQLGKRHCSGVADVILPIRP